MLWKNVCILIQISLLFVSEGPVVDRSVLVHVIGWWQPLPEPMLTKMSWANSFDITKCGYSLMCTFTQIDILYAVNIFYDIVLKWMQ